MVHSKRSVAGGILVGLTVLVCASCGGGSSAPQSDLDAYATGSLKATMAANEAVAMAACKAYCAAQDNYRRTDYNKDGVLEYAQSLRGTDSLSETQPGRGDIALIDRSFAAADAASEAPTPKAGYYFKVLKAQGDHAPGGARSYVLNGHMTGGYALIAYPAEYDRTGKNSFLIDNTGAIYRKDYGAQTQAIAGRMTAFDPEGKDRVQGE